MYELAIIALELEETSLPPLFYHLITDIEYET